MVGPALSSEHPFPAMFVGILQFELLIPGVESIKDKRRVVKSVKDRLHREHLVSVAEVGALEDHTLAMMGLAVVSGTPSHASEVLDRITAKLRGLGDAELGSTFREILGGRSGPVGPVDREADAEVWTPEELREAERLAEEEGRGAA